MEKPGASTPLMILAFAAAFCIIPVRSDLPIHCTADSVVGTWRGSKTELKSSKNNCGYVSPDTNKHHFEHPELYEQAISGASNTMTVDLSHSKEGHAKLVCTGDCPVAVSEPHMWTMVYDEGLYLRVGDEKYFSFFHYSPKTVGEHQVECATRLRNTP